MTVYQKQWEFLKKNFKSGNLAHAFLFSGSDVGSIKKFIIDFIKEINQEVSQADQMIEANSFPDLLIVRSSDSKSSRDNEKDMLEIEIAQVREAQNFLNYKSYYGGFKSLIVENAERMTKEAQNCFLKSLEEPKGKTVIFLITSKPDFLLTTIFSRCQQVKFFHKGVYEISKDEEVVLRDIKKIVDSDLSLKFRYVKAANLEGENFIKIINVLQKYYRQELLSKLTLLNNPESNYAIVKIKKVLRLIETLNYQLMVQNINKKLALEVLLAEI